MSLVAFHRALIAVAIVFCFGYGLWEFAGRSHSGGSLVLGALFTLLGFGLAYYLMGLNRFLGYDGHGEDISRR